MNRRGFLSALGALALLPKLPVRPALTEEMIVSFMAWAQMRAALDGAGLARVEWPSPLVRAQQEINDLDSLALDARERSLP